MKDVYVPHCVCVCVCVYSCSVMSYSLQPRGLQPTGLLCPWNFPGNTGVGCYVLLQRNIPDTGTEPLSPAVAGEFVTIVPPAKPPRVPL